MLDFSEVVFAAKLVLQLLAAFKLSILFFLYAPRAMTATAMTISTRATMTDPLD
jgi:hypothetical protein